MLNQHRKNVKIPVTYFSARFDDAISLKAETILRSVIRQSLEASGTSTLLKDIEDLLMKITQSPLADVTI